MARNPDHFAIVIGIDGYSQLPRLRGSVEDATEFARWLTSDEGGGLPDDGKHVRLIPSPPKLPANPFDARPIQNEIDATLTEFGVENGSRIGTRLYFYFAGHGFGPSFDNIGMLMANASATRLKSSIGLQPYRDLFHEHPLFDEIVYILDCCRDPSHGIVPVGPVFTLQPSNLIGSTTDFVVMAAAYGEKAFQPFDPQIGRRRGLLTQAFLEGLQGAAADPRGRVTNHTLSNYVGKRVQQLADEIQDLNLKQRPEFVPPIDELVLATIPADKLPRICVRITAPAGLQGDLVLRDGADRSEIQRRPAAQATKKTPWEISLVRSRYELHHEASDTSTLIDITDKPDPYTYKFPRPE